MGATLATLRRYIRAEVNDPAPLEKMSTSTITHDGGDNEEDYFQDASYNFVTQGVKVGDVIYNTSDGGSLAVIRQIANGAATNDRLYVSSIEGGTDNDYDNGDVVEIYDRHAQRGLDGTRWTDDEVEDALAQAQKLVAMRHGGVQTYSLAEFESGTLEDGDQIVFSDAGLAPTILVNVEGEHLGAPVISVKRGARLVDVLNHLAVEPGLAERPSQAVKQAVIPQSG